MKTLGSIVKDSTRDLYRISADTSTQEAAAYMTSRNIGAVTIVEGDRVVGLFSERDLMRRVVAKGLDPKQIPVSEVMTTNLVTGSPNDTCEEGVKKMRQAGSRHLPILEGTRFLGLISVRDLLMVEVDEQADELRMLNTYIHYFPPTMQ